LGIPSVEAGRRFGSRREEEAAELEAGPRLRRTPRRAIVWGLSWAKRAARVSSEAAAEASIPEDGDVVEPLLEWCSDGRRTDACALPGSGRE
jgi:hypothetical protein